VRQPGTGISAVNDGCVAKPTNIVRAVVAQAVEADSFAPPVAVDRLRCRVAASIEGRAVARSKYI
jgi:hypothetical protein